MLSNETATLDEVAAAIGRTPAWLQRHWLRFHQRTGFPRRCAGTWVWPRRAVEAWLNSAPAAPPQPANENLPVADPYAAAVNALNQRYGVMA